MEDILTNTISTKRDAKIVPEATNKVNDINRKIIDRIRKLRTGEILINPKQNIQQEINLSGFKMEFFGILMQLATPGNNDAGLTTISTFLLKFRKDINKETNKILQLDSNSPAVHKECDILDKVNTTVHNLIDCAESEGSRRDCYATDMYAMVLISANDGIDKEIIQLYRSIITTNDPKKKKYREKLDSLNEVRQSLEDVVRELIDAEDNHQNIRRIVIDSLREGSI